MFYNIFINSHGPFLCVMHLSLSLFISMISSSGWAGLGAGPGWVEADLCRVEQGEGLGVSLQVSCLNTISPHEIVTLVLETWGAVLFQLPFNDMRTSIQSLGHESFTSILIIAFYKYKVLVGVFQTYILTAADLGVGEGETVYCTVL